MKKLPIIRDTLSFAAVISLCLMLFCFIVICRTHETLTWDVLRSALPPALFSAAVFCLSGLVLGLLLALSVRLMKRDAIRVWLRLQTTRFEAWLAGRNAHVIAPRVQETVCEVIRQQNEALHLLPGEDRTGANDTRLAPYGCVPLFRSGCVFYRFQILADGAPESPDSLRQTLNALLAAHLNRYGLYGLAAWYTYAGRALPALYVDKLAYDTGNRLLHLDVLYIGAPAAADYYTRACQADQPRPVQEPEVYDDEI